MPTVKLKGVVTIDLDPIIKDNNITDLSDPLQLLIIKDKIFEAVGLFILNK